MFYIFNIFSFNIFIYHQFTNSDNNELTIISFMSGYFFINVFISSMFAIHNGWVCVPAATLFIICCISDMGCGVIWVILHVAVFNLYCCGGCIYCIGAVSYVGASVYTLGPEYFSVSCSGSCIGVYVC